MKTLLAFSGGLDSIYVLWKELTETSNDVTAIFFDSSSITENERLSFSIKAVEDGKYATSTWQNVQDLCAVIQQSTRPFTVVKQLYDAQYLTTVEVQYNHGAVLRTAAAIDKLNSNEYDRFVTGHCRDNDGFSASLSPSWRPGTASSLSVQYFKAHATRGSIVFPLYDMQYTTAYALSELPQPWIDMIQYHPISEFKNSNYKYAVQTYAKRLLVEGNTPAQIYDIITQKSVMPNNMWRSQKRWLSDEVSEYKATVDVDWPMPNWASSYTVPG
jgi:hypothetical protein